MKQRVSCGDCWRELEKPGDWVINVDVTDDGIYQETCPNGHQAILIVQDHKFEILFELGLNAVADGYYREAVSSFTSSLERFYEFFIKTRLLHKQIDPEPTWKIVSRQSERQLGAFAFLYAEDFGSPPPIPEKESNFRNEVIHKGKIPTRDEALDYGQRLLEFMRPILQEAKKRYPDGISKMQGIRVVGIYSKLPVGAMPIITPVSTCINTISDDPAQNTKPLRTLLDDLLKRRSQGW